MLKKFSKIFQLDQVPHVTNLTLVKENGMRVLRTTDSSKENGSNLIKFLIDMTPNKPDFALATGSITSSKLFLPRMLGNAGAGSFSVQCVLRVALPFHVFSWSNHKYSPGLSFSGVLKF